MMQAEQFLAQVREATGYETRTDQPVRVIDGDGNEYDVFSVVASTQHGGEIRICVEPTTHE